MLLPKELDKQNDEHLSIMINYCIHDFHNTTWKCNIVKDNEYLTKKGFLLAYVMLSAPILWNNELIKRGIWISRVWNWTQNSKMLQLLCVHFHRLEANLSLFISSSFHNMTYNYLWQISIDWLISYYEFIIHKATFG